MSSSPIVIYLDTSTVIDFCLPSERRHGAAEKLIEICGRYPTEIIVYTSTAAWTEAHGRIYEITLEKKEGITREKLYSQNRSIKHANQPSRTLFPPRLDYLNETTNLLDEKYRDLERRCRFQELDPSSTGFLTWAREIAKYTAIYPFDSLHLALAIEFIASFFVATDEQLIRRVQLPDCSDFIRKAIEDRTKYIDGAKPTLQAVPLVELANLPTPSILTRLRQLGFT